MHAIWPNLSLEQQQTVLLATAFSVLVPLHMPMPDSVKHLLNQTPFGQRVAKWASGYAHTKAVSMTSAALIGKVADPTVGFLDANRQATEKAAELQGLRSSLYEFIGELKRVAGALPQSSPWVEGTLQLARDAVLTLDGGALTALLTRPRLP